MKKIILISLILLIFVSCTCKPKIEYIKVPVYKVPEFTMPNLYKPKYFRFSDNGTYCMTKDNVDIMLTDILLLRNNQIELYEILNTLR